MPEEQDDTEQLHPVCHPPQHRGPSRELVHVPWRGPGALALIAWAEATEFNHIQSAFMRRHDQPSISLHAFRIEMRRAERMARFWTFDPYHIPNGWMSLSLGVPSQVHE